MSRCRPGRTGCFLALAAGVLLSLPAAGGAIDRRAPTVPPIVFVCDGCRNSIYMRLFTVSVSGVVRELPGAVGENLALSPDRRSIVYSEALTPEDGELWRRPLRGRGLMRLTRGPRGDAISLYDFGPDWSPDGRQVAFTRNVHGRNADFANHFSIWLVDARGREPARRLTIGRLPDWSPEGRQIVFLRSSPDGASHFYVIRPDGTHLHLLPGAGGDASRPRWSPDGKRIAFTSWAAPDSGAPDQIRILDLASGRVRTIARPLSASGVVWSRDGRWLAYVTTEDEDPDSGGGYCGGCHANIWIVRVGDGRQREIFSQDDAEISGLDW